MSLPGYAQGQASEKQACQDGGGGGGGLGSLRSDAAAVDTGHGSAVCPQTHSSST